MNRTPPTALALVCGMMISLGHGQLESVTTVAARFDQSGGGARGAAGSGHQGEEASLTTAAATASPRHRLFERRLLLLAEVLHCAIEALGQ